MFLYFPSHLQASQCMKAESIKAIFAGVVIIFAAATRVLAVNQRRFSGFFGHLFSRG
jgi:hypothetical protein